MAVRRESKWIGRFTRVKGGGGLADVVSVADGVRLAVAADAQFGAASAAAATGASPVFENVLLISIFNLQESLRVFEIPNGGARMAECEFRQRDSWKFTKRGRFSKKKNFVDETIN